MPAPVQVAVVAFDRISPFHLSIPSVVFGEGLAPEGSFAVSVCSAEGEQLGTSAGYQVLVQHGLELLEASQIIILPSWRDPDERPPQALLDALRKAHHRGAQVVGLCLGAYVLAAAGLLQGRQATTHWAYAEDFQRRFPEVALEPDVLYVEDGGITTSAGTAAAIDCCLHMLRARLGAEPAARVARMLVVPPHREGGQAQYIDRPLPSAARDTVVTELIDWVRLHLNQQHSVDSLAARALMSRRTFTRRFRQVTGSSVKQWLLNERLLCGQRLLETTDLGLDRVAEQAGFGSAVTLRQQFQKTFGISPSAWRKSFRGKRGASQC